MLFLFEFRKYYEKNYVLIYWRDVFLKYVVNIFEIIYVFFVFDISVFFINCVF